MRFQSITKMFAANTHARPEKPTILAYFVIYFKLVEFRKHCECC